MDPGLTERFWQASGSIGPLRLRVSGGPDDSESPRDLPQPFAVIGRDPKADLSLDHEAVSRRHAYVQVIAGRIFWLDLGSRHGVAQGGVVSPSGWLAEGEAIGLGPWSIGIGAGWGRGREQPSNPMIDRGPASWPDAELEFRGRIDGPARWRLGRVLTLVGRSPDCRLKIPDDNISRFHCAIIRTPGGPWVVDLLSREGVRVSGARVRAAPLDDGAQLHVGRYRMTIRLVSPSPRESDDMPWPTISTLPPDQLPAVFRSAIPPATIGGTIVESSPSVMPHPDLERFVGRLELMQAQMFEQFHQAMMTMFQTFGAMQRDQMAQVREELDRIRELSGELQSLQAGTPPPPPRAGSPATPPDRLSTGRSADGKEDRPSRPSPALGGDERDRDYHELITRRVAEIQGERQGRWKRVLDLISNGGS